MSQLLLARLGADLNMSSRSMSRSMSRSKSRSRSRSRSRSPRDRRFRTQRVSYRDAPYSRRERDSRRGFRLSGFL